MVRFFFFLYFIPGKELVLGGCGGNVPSPIGYFGAPSYVGFRVFPKLVSPRSWLPVWEGDRLPLHCAVA